MKKKILVVDDDAEITMIVEDILKHHNYQVIVAHDGLQAIEKSNQEKVDIILLDICMPFFSGFWFCDAFKKRPQTQHIPVIVVSALSDENNIKKAYQMGASAYLKKPFSSGELLEVIEKAVA